ncbi:FAD-binding and (Fe-S)-binding domain-containing protein [Nocardioides sp. cx-173]|uniref:FAD-binding and (Fe-S)-binding domain-containing protein n=1 Tax=Nocardioides sp. cx-173 TaxID=2898796 RepID=UPI001E2E71D9|nr:FAD-binding and (Fe-S)-binding domain-containing protein [Nocardioides sp. cx-173]MCD4523994.1 FAD-binding oxidoreductase [Nocardioides sp. cx-173]UGB41395.1 FAD-binding oxidoreductase [Nocardioides sp. cx-173]
MSDLVAALRREGIADVDDSALARALYSSDASLYRVVPRVVVRPRHRDELDAVLAVARSARVPVTMRGAGTSIAGNAVGEGIVVDTSRHLRRILEIDPEARTARVEPGVVHAALQAATAPYGLRLGPDPSTHTRCTIGGMVGNNACGSRALGYGRTSDNVVAVDALFGSGETDVSAALGALADAHLAHLRTHFGRFSRQVSGYALEQLLPENGRRVDRLLAGSEGTLALLRDVTVSLVAEETRHLVVLGYPSMIEAADAVPSLLAVESRPRLSAAGGRLVACEGLDSRIVDLVRARRAVPELPRGAGWLFVEVAGEDAESLLADLEAASGCLDRRRVSDPGEVAQLWRIREDGAGLAARSLATPAYSGWEDAAVPPERLGAWLRDFDELLREHGLDGVPYGHFGDGCVHVRIDFPFHDATGGRRVFRDFLTASALRLREHGGSLSGEHGDGRARSELLPLMYDADSLALFGAVKAACDPDGLLNPGVLVAPAPLDADLRPGRPRLSISPALRLTHDGGSLGDAVHRCTGVGKCVAATSADVMCPSYQATREEKDSTRGRARVLQEALDGTLVHGLADPAVHEALDLCLSCKGCASDCPTGVDLATYKAEVLHQTYRGRRRPRGHYTLGRLPAWADRVAPAAGVANALLRFGAVARLAKAGAGIDRRRSLPAFARRTLRAQARSAEPGAPDVWVWADSFTDHFHPVAGTAAVRVLAAAGLTARVIPEDACCAITWVTTGQLDRARTILARTVATLAPYVASGVPVLGLEPSCLATLRSDAVQLTEDPRAAVVAGGVLTLAELWERLRWPLPDLTGTEVVAQPHCHHASVLGWDADDRLLAATGASVTRVAGCCGLAGSFGMEQGHYEVSVAVAETHLLPAVRAAAPGAVVLADGLSCRLQLDDLAGVRAMHLAELLAPRLPG